MLFFPLENNFPIIIHIVHPLTCSGVNGTPATHSAPVLTDIEMHIYGCLPSTIERTRPTLLQNEEVGAVSV